MIIFQFVFQEIMPHAKIMIPMYADVSRFMYMCHICSTVLNINTEQETHERSGMGSELFQNGAFVPFADITDIYVTAHRCAGGLKKKVGLQSGSHAILFCRVP